MPPRATAKPAADAAGPRLDAATRIAVLKGPDAYLRFLYTAELRKVLAAAHGEVDTIRFDGATAQVADVLDECRSFGLVQQHKLVVVDDADDFVKEASRPLVERYAQAPAEQATLLLRAETWHAGKLDALIEKVGAIVDCEPITPAKAAAWAVRRATRTHGAALDEGAAEVLVEKLGADLGRIDSELAKLSVAALADPKSAGKPAITRELVVELTGATREEEAWPFQATLAEGDPAQILAGLSNLLDVARQDPAFIAFILGDAARKLHAASALMRSGMNPFQAAGAARLWGSSKDAMVERARRSNPADLARLLEVAVESETRIKSGLADPVRAVTATALRFASGRR